MQELKKRTAQRIVGTLGDHQQYPWCGRTLTGLRLPPTLHSDSRYLVWQRRFYPFYVDGCTAGPWPGLRPIPRLRDRHYK